MKSKLKPIQIQEKLCHSDNAQKKYFSTARQTEICINNISYLASHDLVWYSVDIVKITCFHISAEHFPSVSGFLKCSMLHSSPTDSNFSPWICGWEGEAEAPKELNFKMMLNYHVGSSWILMESSFELCVRIGWGVHIYTHLHTQPAAQKHHRLSGIWILMIFFCETS